MDAKQKYYLLLGAIVVLFFSSYFFGFRKTIDQRKFNKQTQLVLAEADQAPQLIQQLENRLTGISAQMAKRKYDRATLFELVNTACRKYDLQLNTFATEQRDSVLGYTIISNPFEIQGTYANSLALIHELESADPPQFIAHLDFNAKTDRRSRKRLLKTSFIIQHIQ